MVLGQFHAVLGALQQGAVSIPTPSSSCANEAYFSRDPSLVGGSNAVLGPMVAWIFLEILGGL